MREKGDGRPERTPGVGQLLEFEQRINALDVQGLLGFDRQCALQENLHVLHASAATPDQREPPPPRPESSQGPAAALGRRINRRERAYPLPLACQATRSIGLFQCRTTQLWDTAGAEANARSAGG